MKKIGILTFHRAVNYGAVLQAFALCRKIEELGRRAELIDYRCKAVENCYYHWIPDPFRPKQLVKNILGWPKQKKRNKRFLRFAEQYLPISCYRADKPEELDGHDQEYECVIAGSDQVWNQLCTNGDRAYYLGFVKEKGRRISYAASFGKVGREYIDNEEYRILLNDFSSISVREAEGREIVREMTGKEAQICLDPSFLLERNDWENFTQSFSEDYVFIYSIDMPPVLVDAAERIAALAGLNVIYITLNNIFRKTGWKDVSDSGPEGFLSYMASARYVITNSFHGTAFSIIFKREFFLQPHYDSKMDNSRLTNLLKTLGLEGQLLKKDETPDLTKTIDYNEVDFILKELRDKSVNYLKEVLH